VRRKGKWSETGVTRRRFVPPRGDARAALQGAATKVDVTLETPIQHNNPLGLLATTAEWKDGKLTLHDTSQWVYNVRDRLAGVFGIDAADVQVICPFTGGAFGCTLHTWGHVVLAAMAAQVVKRPVKLVLSRRQMFTSNGYRPETRHRVQLGADETGKLAAISHEAFHTTSRYEEYTEAEINATRFLYGCENVDTPYKIVPVDMSTPWVSGWR
jgi:xanthine dehydrogenase YagR molybdenum-binding subunit